MRKKNDRIRVIFTFRIDIVFHDRCNEDFFQSAKRNHVAFTRFSDPRFLNSVTCIVSFVPGQNDFDPVPPSLTTSIRTIRVIPSFEERNCDINFHPQIRADQLFDNVGKVRFQRFLIVLSAPVNFEHTSLLKDIERFTLYLLETIFRKIRDIDRERPDTIFHGVCNSRRFARQDDLFRDVPNDFQSSRNFRTFQLVSRILRQRGANELGHGVQPILFARGGARAFFPEVEIVFRLRNFDKQIFLNMVRNAEVDSVYVFQRRCIDKVLRRHVSSKRVRVFLARGYRRV